MLAPTDLQRAAQCSVKATPARRAGAGRFCWRFNRLPETVLCLLSCHNLEAVAAGLKIISAHRSLMGVFHEIQVSPV